MKVFFFLFSLFSFSQVSNEIEELAAPLETITYAEEKLLGYSGQRESKIYKYYEKLDKKASSLELKHYALNGSNALRYYAINSLINRNHQSVKDIYTFYFHNEIIITYSYYDVTVSMGITEIIKTKINRISNNIKKYSKWNIEQVKKIQNEISIIEKDIDFYLPE